MTTYLFPGQGSQTKGMGNTLFSEFTTLTAQANAILGYSIETLCQEDPHAQLSQTQFTQPALYVVNALTYFKTLQTTGQKPKYVAGHSLGEYNALLAAEVFDFETGLKLVKKRGELMSLASGGAMAAIIGLNADTIQQILNEQALSGVCIANYNSYTQTVITGEKSHVEHAQTILSDAGASLVIPLKVSGAFHSPLMASARQSFELFLNEFTFSPPRITVIANTTALPYPSTSIATLLSEQITQSVRWTDTIAYLIAQGETTFEECGPGKVLTGLTKRIKNGQ